jgi:hypothetical protein
VEQSAGGAVEIRDQRSEIRCQGTRNRKRRFGEALGAGLGW